MDIIDKQAAARSGCATNTDHDHGDKYDGEAALWPTAALRRPPSDMDAPRHHADGWKPCEGLAMPPIHDAGGWGVTRFWARCPRLACSARFEGRSEASVERRMREHLGTLRD